MTARRNKRNPILLFFILMTITMIPCLSQVKVKVLEPEIVKSMIPEGARTRVLMWGKHDTMEDLVGDAYLAQPSDGCEAYTNDPRLTASAIFFLKSGSRCSLATQIHNAQVANARALIIEHESSDIADIEVPDHISGKQRG